MTPVDNDLQALLAVDASSAAQAFASGQATPQDLLSACLERIDRFDTLINACNFLRPREALVREAEQAGERYARGAPLSPLDGIPFAVKANIAIRDCPWHAGIGALAARRADEDARAVSVLRHAGMIALGILNMHEAALGLTTNNPTFGQTRNPHDPKRIPGGSSGGSAAAVAAGMVPIALGTDDMGSVRLPSAFCSVVGYKPAFGTIPVAGLVPLSPRLDHIGVHARSVSDIDAVMRLFGEGACEQIPPFAVWRTASTMPMAASVRAAFADVVQKLDCTDSLDWSQVDLSAWRRAGLLLCERDAARTFEAPLRDDPEGFSAAFRAMIDWARSAPSEKFARAEDLIAAASEAMRNDLQGRLLLSPTAPVVAPEIGSDVPDEAANLTAPANFAGVPSISVPIPHAASKMPAGLQITGPSGGEVRLGARTIYPGIAPLAPL